VHCVTKSQGKQSKASRDPDFAIKPGEIDGSRNPGGSPNVVSVFPTAAQLRHRRPSFAEECNRVGSNVWSRIGAEPGDVG
jgi:hypothetical protein